MAVRHHAEHCSDKSWLCKPVEFLPVPKWTMLPAKVDRPDVNVLARGGYFVLLDP